MSPAGVVRPPVGVNAERSATPVGVNAERGATPVGVNAERRGGERFEPLRSPLERHASRRHASTQTDIRSRGQHAN